MATLTRETIQSLAVLRVVTQWDQGACGPVRVHKTLFFADEANDPDWRLFTFKRWHLGQYSDQIAASLNRLQDAGRIRGIFDGPSERIVATVPPQTPAQLRAFFACHFPEWNTAFRKAFKEWADLSNDEILVKAHDDPSYVRSQQGQVIRESSIADQVEFEDLSEDDAERFSDLVNAKLSRAIRSRVREAVKSRARGEDWRSLYFGG